MAATLGINHITFAVFDLERAMDFYVSCLGMRLIKVFERGAYLLSGDLWICLSLDEKARKSMMQDYTHVAFDVSDSEFYDLQSKLEKFGVHKWKDNHSEGKSFYFLDPDNHKLEIHVGTLETRLKSMEV